MASSPRADNRGAHVVAGFLLASFGAALTLFGLEPLDGGDPWPAAIGCALLVASIAVVVKAATDAPPTPVAANGAEFPRAQGAAIKRDKERPTTAPDAPPTRDRTNVVAAVASAACIAAGLMLTGLLHHDAIGIDWSIPGIALLLILGGMAVGGFRSDSTALTGGAIGGAVAILIVVSGLLRNAVPAGTLVTIVVLPAVSGIVAAGIRSGQRLARWVGRWTLVVAYAGAIAVGAGATLPSAVTTSTCLTSTSGASETALVVDGEDAAGASQVYGLQGAQFVQYTSQAGHEPAWSPDGRLIAFAYGNTDTFVMTADRQCTQRVTDGHLPAWSPDGHLIATVPFGGESIFLTPIDGSARRTLPSPTMNGRVAWSPDGRYLAVAGDAGLAIIAVDDGHVVRWLRTDRVESPAWSPDGTVIAYGHSDVGSLEVSRSDGSGQPIVVFAGSKSDFPADPAWVQGSTRIGFVAPGSIDNSSSSEFYIYTIGVDGSGLKNLGGPHFAEHPAWRAAH